MAERQMKLPASVLASKALEVMKSTLGISDSYINNRGGITPSSFHFHGGASAPIAWNDVQEIDFHNKYIGLDKKLPVPSYPSVGYNQHSHTSEYDGGVLPGITGNHTHASARSGGLSFACFYPATGIPQADWES